MDFEQFFHNHCNVTDYTYKGVGEWEGWGGVGWGGVGWVDGGGLQLPSGLFGGSMGTYKKCWSYVQTSLEGLRDISLPQG